MARPREFNADDALNGAMEIFWRQGYKATNLPDLLSAMGLTRGSFYKAFHDKRAVYLDVLDLYDESVVQAAVDMLEACDAPSAPECLAQLFSTSADPLKGCFICNAMIELGADDEEIRAKTTAMADRLRSAIQAVIEGYGVETNPGIARARADLILHLYFGHHAIDKTTGTRSDWTERLAGLLS